MHEYRRFGELSALSIDLIFPLSIIKQFPRVLRWKSDVCNIKKPFAYFSAFPLGFPINIRPRDHMIHPNIITRCIDTVVSLLSLLSYVTAEENGQKLLIRDLSSHPWFPPQANLQLTKESIKNCFFLVLERLFGIFLVAWPTFFPPVWSSIFAEKSPHCSVIISNPRSIYGKGAVLCHYW